MIEGQLQMANQSDKSHPSSQVAVLHIPHSSRYIPAKEREAIILDDAALDAELLRMTDAYTDELFPVTTVEAGRIILPVSRLVCDVERFPIDEDEPMAKRGMGVIYNRTSMGGVLRANADAVPRQTILDHLYWPHHVELEQQVNSVIERSGLCLIVDCHSFASVALPYELDQTSERADICVGTDPFHTPSSVREPF
jgi:N-formylglutamate deformylase